MVKRKNWIGEKRGSLTIINKTPNKSGYYDCLCDCGNTKSVRLSHMNSGATKTCGNMCPYKPTFKNVTGQRFGKLVAIEYIREETGMNRWLCQCDCGNQSKPFSNSLLNGKSKSCGCAQGNGIHGMSETPIYHIWEGMIARCGRKSSGNYKYYGKLGVKVCKRWRTFTNFLDDMGINPDGMTLDRINPFGNYEPSNCRWATPKQQANNRRIHNSELNPDERKTDGCAIG